jgi:phosphate transport system substrate-binding protein
MTTSNPPRTDTMSASRRAIDRRSFLCVTAAGLMASACGNTVTVTTSGATTVQHILSLAAEPFTAETGIRVDTQGGGSTRGVFDVVTGRAHVGGIAREPTASERKLVNFRPLARDAIAVIVHPSSPLVAITSQEIRSIYTDPLNRMALTRVVMAEGHGTRDAFLAHLAVQPAELAADVSANSVNELVLTVSRLPRAIGFVSNAEAHASISEDRSVRIVPLDGIDATAATVADSRYPMIRTMYCGVRPVVAHEAMRFLDFLGSARAHAIMADLGFVPAAARS